MSVVLCAVVQNSITKMIENCMHNVFEETDPATGKKMFRSYDAAALAEIKQNAPVDCDFNFPQTCGPSECLIHSHAGKQNATS